MTKHVWRVKKQYFHQLKSGEKSLEIRVGYPQIRKVRQGDIITFENYGFNEFNVKRITCYDSFKRMLQVEGVNRVLPGMTFDGALRALRGIYPRDKEVLGVYVFELEYRGNTKPAHTMIKASNLLKDGKTKKFSRVIADSYRITDWISNDYPNHTEIYYTKYVPGIFSGEREIISCYIDEEIVATAILKKDSEEKKVCTFFVQPEYRKRGIASELFQQCFKWLGTTKPLITIADYKLSQFAKIIERYGWTETQVLERGYYNDHSQEHVFNGKIN